MQKAKITVVSDNISPRLKTLLSQAGDKSKKVLVSMGCSSSELGCTKLYGQKQTHVGAKLLIKHKQYVSMGDCFSDARRCQIIDKNISNTFQRAIALAMPVGAKLLIKT